MNNREFTFNISGLNFIIKNGTITSSYSSQQNAQPHQTPRMPTQRQDNMHERKRKLFNDLISQQNSLQPPVDVQPPAKRSRPEKKEEKRKEILQKILAIFTAYIEGKQFSNHIIRYFNSTKKPIKTIETLNEKILKNYNLRLYRQSNRYWLEDTISKEQLIIAENRVIIKNNISESSENFNSIDPFLLANYSSNLPHYFNANVSSYTSSDTYAPETNPFQTERSISSIHPEQPVAPQPEMNFEDEQNIKTASIPTSDSNDYESSPATISPTPTPVTLHKKQSYLHETNHLVPRHLKLFDVPKFTNFEKEVYTENDIVFNTEDEDADFNAQIASIFKQFS